MSESESELLALLGYVYLQNGQPEKSAVLLAALDVLTPYQPAVIRLLAVAQIRCDKPAAALESLDRLAMAGAADAVFHLLRAQALAALERMDEARLAMNNYMQLRPGRAPAAPEAR